MKTKEFKEKVSGLGYKIETDRHTLTVIYVSSMGSTVSEIDRENRNGIYLDTDDFGLIKLCLEYAKTPIEEREEEKKYIVILPDPRNDGEYRYALCKRHDGIGIGHVHRSGYSKLTEAEIKRNHEYLWQFAKEVVMD